MKWTLNTYEVAQKWELEHLISMCQQTGYPYIEFLMDFDQPHGLEWDTPAERFQEVKQKLDAAGLKYGSLTSCQTFHSPDAAERAESVKRVKCVIDRARCTYQGISLVFFQDKADKGPPVSHGKDIPHGSP